MSKMTVELGLHLTTSGVSCLFLFRIPWYVVVLEFSVSSAKECRPAADPSNENNEGKEKCDHVWLGGTLDAELPNVEPQLPTASCMVGVLNVMQHMLTSPRSDKAEICQVCRFIAHPEKKQTNGNTRPHNTAYAVVRNRMRACGSRCEAFFALTPHTASFGLRAPSSPH